mmetsp:Transcript_43387/g.116134  ORF Transcript_43387/g.116134 Transcript_43387/m.116134 type:complete len:103 (+) Transcript_43387:129-437(+)
MGWLRILSFGWCSASSFRSCYSLSYCFALSLTFFLLLLGVHYAYYTGGRHHYSREQRRNWAVAVASLKRSAPSRLLHQQLHSPCFYHCYGLASNLELRMVQR